MVGGIGRARSGRRVDAGAEATLDVTLAQGAAWELPDAGGRAALPRGVRRGDARRSTPTWRFGDAGELLDGAAARRLPGVTP